MKIKSIKKIGKRKTYDLSMDKNHNFLLSNGVLSHNSEVRGMIEGSDDLLLINEMPSQKSREVTCDPLKKDRRMTDRQIAYIGWKIKIHEVCIVERGKQAKILKRINPPRCRYWKSEYGDFESLWKKEVNLYEKLDLLTENYSKKYLERKELLQSRDYEKKDINEVVNVVKKKPIAKKTVEDGNEDNGDILDNTEYQQNEENEKINKQTEQEIKERETKDKEKLLREVKKYGISEAKFE